MVETPIVWTNPWTFRVRHPVSGRATDVMIPGAEKLDPRQLEDIVAWQTEETLGELAGPETRIASQPHSKAFQHELGRALNERDESYHRVQETGHGRYW